MYIGLAYCRYNGYTTIHVYISCDTLFNNDYTKDHKALMNIHAIKSVKIHTIKLSNSATTSKVQSKGMTALQSSM